MAEFDKTYASNGKGNLGVTLGAVGTGLGLLGGALGLGNGGLFNNGLAPRGGNFEDSFVTRYDADKDAKISKLEQTIALGEAEKYTDQKIIDVYERLSARIRSDEENVNAQIQTQAVYNATNTANINCMSNQIAQLQSMTKLYIPSANVSPQPMSLYNSWAAPTTA